MKMVNAETDAQEYALDRDCTTLSRHVLQQLQSFSAEAQDLSALMNRIALAGKIIARRLSRAGLMEGVWDLRRHQCAGRIRQKDGCLCK
jgi:fructose-1,6-bisphosphatase I